MFIRIIVAITTVFVWLINSLVYNSSVYAYIFCRLILMTGFLDKYKRDRLVYDSIDVAGRCDDSGRVGGVGGKCIFI